MKDQVTILASGPTMHVIRMQMRYCRFGNFRENFIFARIYFMNSIKRHISDTKKFAIKARFKYINKRQSYFAISRGLIL